MEREVAPRRVKEIPLGEGELDFSGMKGRVWKHFREHSPKTLQALWEVKTIMRSGREEGSEDDALDEYLLANPDIDTSLSERIPDLDNKSALKLLSDEVERDMQFPHLAEQPVIKQSAA